ncbi:hypothetical protein BDQ17DRAFT_1424862 [Cyathus striatus]|nr:hypothetical protein BDQ17DRAFT_1424862 [Cyathus striatus]
MSYSSNASHSNNSIPCSSTNSVSHSSANSVPRSTNVSPCSSNVSDAGCAVHADGTLKDVSEIQFFYDKDDDLLMATTLPSESEDSVTEASNTKGKAPIKVHTSTRKLKPSQCVCEAAESEVNSRAARKPQKKKRPASGSPKSSCQPPKKTSLVASSKELQVDTEKELSEDREGTQCHIEEYIKHCKTVGIEPNARTLSKLPSAASEGGMTQDTLDSMVKQVPKPPAFSWNGLFDHIIEMIVCEDELAFETVEGHHNGVNTTAVIMCTIDRYNLYGKLGWITSDGASVNRTTIQELKKLLSFSDIEWTAKEHDILCMEHAVHLSAKHFVQTIAPASSSVINKKIKAALKKSSRKGDLDLDELVSRSVFLHEVVKLAKIDLEAENEGEGDGKDEDEVEGEARGKDDGDDNFTFQASDSLGKALALVKQIHKSPQAHAYFKSTCTQFLELTFLRKGVDQFVLLADKSEEKEEMALSNPHAKLEQYLSLGLEPKELQDVVGWWGWQSDRKYPTLNSGGITDVAHCNRLTPEIFSALQILKSAYQNGHIEALIAELYGEQDDAEPDIELEPDED